MFPGIKKDIMYIPFELFYSEFNDPIDGPQYVDSMKGLCYKADKAERSLIPLNPEVRYGTILYVDEDVAEFIKEHSEGNIQDFQVTCQEQVKANLVHFDNYYPPKGSGVGMLGVIYLP